MPNAGRLSAAAKRYARCGLSQATTSERSGGPAGRLEPLWRFVQCAMRAAVRSARRRFGIPRSFGVAELDEQRDDGVEDDALGGEQFTHVANELLGRHAFALFVFLLKGSDGQLPLGGGLHEAVHVVVVH